MTGTAHPFGVLIAAHGGRHIDRHSNGSIIRLAENVAARLGGAPVGVGYINGVPAIDAAIAALAVRDIIVYPLFMADGHFGHAVLERLIEEARGSRPEVSVTMLPPLGLDPALADLVVGKAASAAASFSVPLDEVTLVLLAHGSTRGRASAAAAGRTAEHALAHRLFADVRVAFLDEAPSLQTTVSDIKGPAAVAGLFSGDGLHGGGDAARLMAQLEHDDVIYVGNAGLFAGLENLISTAVNTALSARLARLPWLTANASPGVHDTGSPC
ncbi:MAG TPA: CbiX/SirB N-terminal domain-containing protein [Pseudolabrys sp.]|nr:CbiX/SirB N-terminal domain-containing protein [Pseudolabrys sp.]